MCKKSVFSREKTLCDLPCAGYKFTIAQKFLKAPGYMMFWRSAEFANMYFVGPRKRALKPAHLNRAMSDNATIVRGFIEGRALLIAGLY